MNRSRLRSLEELINHVGYLSEGEAYNAICETDTNDERVEVLASLYKLENQGKVKSIDHQGCKFFVPIKTLNS